MTNSERATLGIPQGRLTLSALNLASLVLAPSSIITFLSLVSSKPLS
jgi:hypothetical protein